MITEQVEHVVLFIVDRHGEATGELFDKVCSKTDEGAQKQLFLCQSVGNYMDAVQFFAKLREVCDKAIVEHGVAGIVQPFGGGLGFIRDVRVNMPAG